MDVVLKGLTEDEDGSTREATPKPHRSESGMFEWEVFWCIVVMTPEAPVIDIEKFACGECTNNAAHAVADEG